MIYFVQAGESGPIKIGHTKNVANRLVKMQVDCHERLTVLGVMAGELAAERALHTKFSEHRIRGEWFAPMPELLLLAATNPPPPSEKNCWPKCRPKNLYVWRHSNGSFRAPYQTGINYLARPETFAAGEADFLKSAFIRINADDPDDWPDWWGPHSHLTDLNRMHFFDLPSDGNSRSAAE